MTELEKIEYAKSFIDKLANGINPLDDTIMSLNNNNIVTLIQSNITLFEKFDKVYLFGSVVDDNKFPNDVDILLIYGILGDRNEKQHHKGYGEVAKRRRSSQLHIRDYCKPCYRRFS